MHESILRDYFLGLLDDSRLGEDLEGSAVRTSSDATTHYVNPMDSEFRVEPAHLVRLCDAVLSGSLDAAHLEIIGHCLMTSEHFFFEEETKAGDLAAATAYDWACPETNYPLTVENVRKFRERLVTGVDTFTRADTAQPYRRGTRKR